MSDSKGGRNNGGLKMKKSLVPIKFGKISENK